MSNKKFIINIIVVVLVIGLLAGGLYVLTKPEEKLPISDSMGESEEITIFSAAPSDIISAHVTNKNGSYALSRVNGRWKLEGFEGVSLDYAMLDALTNAFTEVTSSQLIEEAPENPGAYGLSSPTAIIVLGTTGGERTFYVGNETPDGSSYYFNTDASTDVYLMESYVADVIFLTARDYVDLGDTFEAASVTEVRIVPASGSPLHVVMNPGGEKDQYGIMSYWNITEPVERNASNSDVVTLITTPVSELESTASGIYEDTDENRARTGLAVPEYTIEVVTDGDRIIYHLGAVDGEYRYIRREGDGYILRVDNDGCSFVNTSFESVSERYLALIDIATLRSVEISVGDKSKVFTVLDGAGENAAFYVDNTELTAERFREFYQHIVALQVSGVTDHSPAEQVLGSITYKLISGESLTLEFAPYDERNYGVYINGQRQYIMLRKNVEEIFDLFREF